MVQSVKLFYNNIMDYITKVKNMVIIQSIVLAFRFFNLLINFTYLFREYFALILLQNFCITVCKFLNDLYYISLGVFFPEYVYQQESNNINYLTRDHFHKLRTHTITMIDKTTNLIIYILIFLTNSYLLSIGMYYDEKTLADFYENSKFMLPILNNNDQYNNLNLLVENENFSDFINFIILFSTFYPILAMVPPEKEKKQFIIIEGTPLAENKESKCIICWENSCDWSLQCKHQFHYECIKEWNIKKDKNTCPYCRSIVRKNYYINLDQTTNSDNQREDILA